MIDTEARASDTGAVETTGTARRSPRRARRRSSLVFDLAMLGVIGVLLFAALAATGSWVYQKLYSPTAFVQDYLELLSQGRAADALAIPGVTVRSEELEGADMPTNASDVLLRRDALAPLSDITAVSSEERDGITYVTVSYTAGNHAGQSTFEVEQDGWDGIVPAWRFAKTPLAVIDLTVEGATAMTINGFSLDKRQLGVGGTEVDLSGSTPMLVFTPGLYSVSVSTAISESPGVAVLSDAPSTNVPVEVTTEATDEFVATVQARVNDFLDQCAAQAVLQPAGCPFGYLVQDRLGSDPSWSIVTDPVVELSLDGDTWKIESDGGTAEIAVDIRSIFDGSIRHVVDQVPFEISGSVTIREDDSAEIEISSDE